MKDKVICPVCKREGKKSTVRSNGRSTTLLGYSPFYDESGEHHDHNPNRITSEYRCSEGHSWSVTSYKKCWCGWSGGETTIKEYKIERTDVPWKAYESIGPVGYCCGTKVDLTDEKFKVDTDIDVEKVRLPEERTGLGYAPIKIMGEQEVE